MQKKRILLVLITIILFCTAIFAFLTKDAAAPNTNINEQKSTTSETPPPETAPPVFDKSRYSLTDPNSIWVVVNKKRPLPDGFSPADLVTGQLRSEANTKLGELLASTKIDGHNLSILSAYRSQSTQAATYGGYAAKDGAAKADTYSARPGYSEHQTGLAVDLGNGVCNLEACFGGTPAGKWLKNNSHRYGFVIRYPEGKDSITGYQYEPWHLRYVGAELALELQNSGLTMEEFFGLEPAAQY